VPNVLLILTDQQRWDSLGCYGNQVVQTPQLDGLAAEGTVFTRAYSGTPSCVPARASLMTGKPSLLPSIAANSTTPLAG
jgi:arylsulfatase